MAEQTSDLRSEAWFALFLLVLIVLGQAWQIRTGMSVKTQSWEYRIEGPRDEELRETLLKLGGDGWELVSARRATTQVKGETEGLYEMIFRRPTASRPNTE